MLNNDPRNKVFVNNFTQLEHKDADALLVELRDMILQGESNREQRIERSDDAMRIWRGELWSDEDRAVFTQLGIQPYVFRDYRTYLNSLLSQQKRKSYRYGIVPRDLNSFNRNKKNRQAFIEKAIMEGEFLTLTEAEEYYDNYADDKYANVLTAMLQTVRDESSAKSVESDCFENGMITGCHFLKAFFQPQKHHYRAKKQPSFWPNPLTGKRLAWSDPRIPQYAVS